MIFSDILSISLGNLWRMKLRSFLTVSGVVIGIAALVSMMSFGAGMQKNVSDQFKALEIFNILTILPGGTSFGEKQHQDYHDENGIETQTQEKTAQDTISTKPLNDHAIAEIEKIPGVRVVYPEDTFPVRLKLGDRYANTTAEAIPASMGDIVAKEELLAGRSFASDSAQEVVIHKRLLSRLGIEIPDSALGREISLISAKVDLGSAMGMFLGRRSSNVFKQVEHTFTICGVHGKKEGMGANWRQLIIPFQTAQKIDRLGFNSAFDLLKQVSGGAEKNQYASLIARMESADKFPAARDSIDNLGYNTFSFADQFEEIRKFFLIFDLILAVVGFIALVVASLGIVNTMVMSIVERYREIGVLKSLGASNADIRWLFLVESSAIGLLGAVIGLAFGWIISRLASAVAIYIMLKQGAPKVDFFYLPLWLIILALCFGTLVALAAGLYPAARAAKVDPVQSLRHD